MRLRFKSWAKDFIAEHKSVIEEKEFSDFLVKTPLELEIGSGKGDFIIELANQNPNKNFLALEKYQSVLVEAVKKFDQTDLKNIYFLNIDAEILNINKNLQSVIGIIYLNHSDPWPKVRHEKRRLTHKRFLEIYKSLLVLDGKIFLKTDNLAFFEFSISEMKAFGMKLSKVDYNFNSDVDWNVKTEYERRFFEKKMPIYRLEAVFNKEGSAIEETIK